MTQTQPRTDDEIEIGEPVVTTEALRVPPGKRLRLALEALPVGHDFTFRSSMERQHIHNVIARVKKTTGRTFTTRRIQKADAEGKVIMRILRLT